MNGTNQRILIASPDYPPDSGGVSLAAFELTRGLTSLGYEVKVLARPTKCFEERDIDKESDVIRLHLNDYHRGFKPTAMKIVTEFRPDCVIING